MNIRLILTSSNKPSIAIQAKRRRRKDLPVTENIGSGTTASAPGKRGGGQRPYLTGYQYFCVLLESGSFFEFHFLKLQYHGTGVF